MLKIYRIVDNTNGNIYIGKTENTLKQRLKRHKIDKDCVSREIIKNGDYKIELIEETDDDTRERYWILNTDCINHNIPGRTQKEWYADNRVYPPVPTIYILIMLLLFVDFYRIFSL